MSPTESDVAAYLQRSGERPLVHLERLGVLGPHVLVGHAVHIDDEEVNALVNTSAAVAYCPWAYLRLGQGVTRAGRHSELMRLGVRVALGCDSENASDALDILRAAALAAGIAKDMAMDPGELGAHGAFEMATIGGARAIGLDAVIGSIEVGKAADLVVHECTGPQWNPRARDVVQQLVWSSDGRSVRDVIVGGQPVVRDRAFVNVDALAIYSRVAEAAEIVRATAGITPASRWPERRFD
jgi:5-methylthioadenosine/S-adenosylhomocysteine deaminase